jgi:hypothetical protein
MERRRKLRRMTQEGRAEFVWVLRKQSLKQKMEKVAAGEFGVDEEVPSLVAGGVA